MDKKLTSNRICIYLAEGECEEKLLNVLKQKPSLIAPGRVRKFNVVQNELKASHLMSFPSRSNVVLVFDTDVEETECLKKNIELLKNQFGKVEITDTVVMRAMVDHIIVYDDHIEVIFKCGGSVKQAYVRKS